MMLLPLELRSKLPALYSQQHIAQPQAVLRYYCLDGPWEFYVVEGDCERDECTLLGFEPGERGGWYYLTLANLEGARGPFGERAQLDTTFVPSPICAQA